MLLASTQKFLKELHRIGAVKVDAKKGFRLALHDKNPDAPLSPFYINLRTPDNKDGPLQTAHVESIATELMSAAKRHHIDYDAVAGIPNAGTPLALAVERVSGMAGTPAEYVHMYKVSPDTREMRAVRWVSGARRVLLVDDLITRADSKLTAVTALQEAGYEVAGIVVYLDREQGGVRELRRMRIPVFAVLKISEILDFYGDEKLISKKDLRTIQAYLKQ